MINRPPRPTRPAHPQTRTTCDSFPGASLIFCQSSLDKSVSLRYFVSSILGISALCRFMEEALDNRDEALIAQIEVGELSAADMILLIGILSTRRLGPDTIEGIEVIDIRHDDPRVVKHCSRVRVWERAAFELIRVSHWYDSDKWPDPPTEVMNLIPDHDFGFCRWVDLRLQNLDMAEAIRFGLDA